MGDIISRQAAIDALIRKMRPHDNGDGTTTICVMSEGLVREVIMGLPTAEPKWIPCSERLPSNKEHVDDMVLVCYGNGSIRFNTCMNGNWVQGNPIAWMPLPKPYEEE